MDRYEEFGKNVAVCNEVTTVVARRSEEEVKAEKRSPRNEST